MVGLPRRSAISALMGAATLTLLASAGGALAQGMFPALPDAFDEEVPESYVDQGVPF